MKVKRAANKTGHAFDVFLNVVIIIYNIYDFTRLQDV